MLFRFPGDLRRLLYCVVGLLHQAVVVVSAAVDVVYEAAVISSV